MKKILLLILFFVQSSLFAQEKYTSSNTRAIGAYERSTVYLGQNLPSKNIDELVERINPTHAITFNISRKKPTDIQNHINAIKKHSKNVNFLIGGNLQPMTGINQIKNVNILGHPDDLLVLLTK
mgnify:CR=1 FL=1